jgi:hypothetical protein
MIANRRQSAHKEQETTVAVSEIENAISKREKPLVFISHDSRDADLAEAFANLLTDVSAGTLKSFRSSSKQTNSGIEFGAEWYRAIMSQLGDATDVVALLTRHSIDRPWILYEAGVAKGKLDTNVLGIALGVPLDKVSVGPFGQFQNCADDEDSLTKLVIQLLSRNPDASPREAAIRTQVKTFIEHIKPSLSSPEKPVASSSEDNSTAKLFEEVKAMVRDLPDRIDEKLHTISLENRNTIIKPVNSYLFEEISFRFLRKEEDFSLNSFLIILSLYKDTLPWVYEVGIELYHALKRHDEKEIYELRDQFQNIIDLSLNMPIFRFKNENPEMSYYLLRKIPSLLEKNNYCEKVYRKRSIDKSSPLDQKENK